MKPTAFRALTPKLTVKVGDVVKAGDALFTDKANPGIKFTAPVSGCIEAINRGERRKLLEVVIKADSEITYRDFGKADVNQLSREEICLLYTSTPSIIDKINFPSFACQVSKISVSVED